MSTLIKLETLFWALLVILIAFWGLEEHAFNIKCRDAGGIPVDNKCINPSAIIELN